MDDYNFVVFKGNKYQYKKYKKNERVKEKEQKKTIQITGILYTIHSFNNDENNNKKILHIIYIIIYHRLGVENNAVNTYYNVEKYHSHFFL